MKKISNEFKVGLTALIAITVFIWLFNFLKGENIISRSSSYYAVYDKIDGLVESSPVEINGYKVGVVQSIEFLPDGRLIVEISVEKDFDLPENTVAEITTATILAGMKIQLILGTGPGVYESGDTIQGRLAVSILDKVETEFVPLKDKIEKMVISLDSVISSINEIMNPEFKKNLNNSLTNLNSTTENISNILGSREAELKATIKNISQFSEMLAENSDLMDTTFMNLKTISDSIASADLYSTVLNLKTSLERTSLLLANLNEGNGTAGQLLTNDSVYINMNNSLEDLDILLKDLKTNPKRYIHFSVFGGKD
jgi:phospholipid/cholesterol/gamma-HCH transport system substrate-binding protein